MNHFDQGLSRLEDMCWSVTPETLAVFKKYGDRLMKIAPRSLERSIVEGTIQVGICNAPLNEIRVVAPDIFEGYPENSRSRILHDIREGLMNTQIGQSDMPANHFEVSRDIFSNSPSISTRIFREW